MLLKDMNASCPIKIEGCDAFNKNGTIEPPSSEVYPSLPREIWKTFKTCETAL